MLKALIQWILAFGWMKTGPKESKEMIHEPVSHPLGAKPDIPKGLMSAIAPSYESVSEKQKQATTRSQVD